MFNISSTPIRRTAVAIILTEKYSSDPGVSSTVVSKAGPHLCNASAETVIMADIFQNQCEGQVMVHVR